MHFEQISLAQITDWLSSRLTPDRLNHVLGVKDTALEWSDRLAVSREDAHRIALASLLHDNAKQWPLDHLEQYLTRNGHEWGPADRLTPAVWHAWAGVYEAKTHWRIDDPDILDAIHYHTTGRSGMSMIEKIVFVADKIESRTRDMVLVSKWQQQVAELPYNKTPHQTLDNWVAVLIGNSIQYLARKRHPIHPDTVKAWNYGLSPCGMSQTPTTKLSVVRCNTVNLEDQPVVSL